MYKKLRPNWPLYQRRPRCLTDFLVILIGCNAQATQVCLPTAQVQFIVKDLQFSASFSCQTIESRPKSEISDKSDFQDAVSSRNVNAVPEENIGTYQATALGALLAKENFLQIYVNMKDLEGYRTDRNTVAVLLKQNRVMSENITVTVNYNR